MPHSLHTKPRVCILWCISLIYFKLAHISFTLSSNNKQLSLQLGISNLKIGKKFNDLIVLLCRYQWKLVKNPTELQNLVIKNAILLYTQVTQLRDQSCVGYLSVSTLIRESFSEWVSEIEWTRPRFFHQHIICRQIQIAIIYESDISITTLLLLLFIILVIHSRFSGHKYFF